MKRDDDGYIEIEELERARPLRGSLNGLLLALGFWTLGCLILKWWLS